jgi:cell division protein ZapA
MSTVTLTIGPKNYPVACAEGEEAHISELGAMIAEKYALLGTSRAPLEAQNLLFAALFLADELAEARKGKPGKPAPQDSGEVDSLRAKIVRLESELAAAKQAPPAPQTDLFGGPDASGTLADRLELLAAEAEARAAALEAAAANA